MVCGRIGGMMLPVYVPDWQIGDGDIERPVIGMAFDHVLIFTTDPGDPDLHYGSFGQEATVSGIAEPLAGSGSRSQEPSPTAIHGEGFTLFWAAPVLVEGPVTVTGTIDATDYGAAPEGFPSVAGVVDSMELTSVLYINPDGGGVNWEPAPGKSQEFRPVGEYPRHVPGIDAAVNPQRQVTGVVLQLRIGAVAVPGGDSESSMAAKQHRGPGGSPTRIRIFPDNAKTILWLDGPVDCADAALSPGLAAGMAEWEQSYRASLDTNQAWRSPDVVAQFTATGNSLAQQLAQELGHRFEVEFRSYAAGSRRQLFHSAARAGNPAASRALSGIVAAADAERARLAALAREAGTGWFAYAPLSGTVFNPGNVPLPVQFQDPAPGQ